MFQPLKRNPSRSMNRGDSFASPVAGGPSFSPGLKPRKEHEGYFDDHAEFGDFTPDERSKIGEHISKKIKEGWPREQAVAASINIVAPGKSRGAKHSDDTGANLAAGDSHHDYHDVLTKHGYEPTGASQGTRMYQHKSGHRVSVSGGPGGSAYAHVHEKRRAPTFHQSAAGLHDYLSKLHGAPK